MVYETAVNITGLVEMFSYANRVTDNIFIIMLLITVYVIPLIYMIRGGYKWDESSLVAGFFVVITAIMMRVTEIITVDRYVFYAIATIIIPLVTIFLKD